MTFVTLTNSREKKYSAGVEVYDAIRLDSVTCGLR